MNKFKCTGCYNIQKTNQKITLSNFHFNEIGGGGLPDCERNYTANMKREPEPEGKYTLHHHEIWYREHDRQ